MSRLDLIKSMCSDENISDTDFRQKLNAMLFKSFKLTYEETKQIHDDGKNERYMLSGITYHQDTKNIKYISVSPVGNLSERYKATNLDEDNPETYINFELE